MRHRAAARTVVLLMALAVRTAEAQGPPGMAMPPPQVALATAEVKTFPVSYEYVGMTAASKTVEVRARVQGFLETRDFTEGAYLKEGARLFTIDPRSFKADKEIAEAQVAQAESRLRLAQQEVKRLKSVNQPGAIAQSDLDQRLAEESSAEAALRLAKAQLAKAELELSYTTVAAPLTGFIGKALKDIGSLVDGAQNSLLAIMQQVDPLYVSFQVSESDFLEWRRQLASGEVVLAAGNKAQYLDITLLDGTDYGEHGSINFEDVSVNVKTGTVELRGVFKNADKKLKPGQYVKVHLNGWERPNTLTAPKRAVGQSPQGPYVYVVGSDNKAERRVVKTGGWSGDDCAILDGLKAGERVIVEGLTKVRPGGDVAPASASAAIGQTEPPAASSGQSKPPAAR